MLALNLMQGNLSFGYGRMIGSNKLLEVEARCSGTRERDQPRV